MAAGRKMKRGSGSVEALAPACDEEDATPAGVEHEPAAAVAERALAPNPMPNARELQRGRREVAEAEARIVARASERRRLQEARESGLRDNRDVSAEKRALTDLEEKDGEDRERIAAWRPKIAALEPLADGEQVEAEELQRLADERAIAEAMARGIPSLCAALHEIVAATPAAADHDRYVSANHEYGAAWRAASQRRNPELLRTLLTDAVKRRLAAIDETLARRRAASIKIVPCDTLIYALKGLRYANRTDPEHGERQIIAGLLCYVPRVVAEAAAAQKLAQVVPEPAGQLRVHTVRDVTTSDGRRFAADRTIVVPAGEALTLLASGAVRPRTVLTRDEIVAYRNNGYPERERDSVYGVDVGTIDTDGTLTARPNAQGVAA